MDILIFLGLAAVAVSMAVSIVRYRRALYTDGAIVQVRMIGGPMDGRDVLAEIGGTYDNFQPMRNGWLQHRYLIRPGGWGVYQGATEIVWPDAPGGTALAPEGEQA